MENQLVDETAKDEMMDTNTIHQSATVLAASDQGTEEVEHSTEDHFQQTSGSNLQQEESQDKHSDIEEACKVHVKDQEESNEEKDAKEEEGVSQAGQEEIATGDGNEEKTENKNAEESKSFMTLIKESEIDNGTSKKDELDEAEILGLANGSRQETNVSENIDEESERALLAVDEEENMDISETDTSDRLQQPQHFGMPTTKEQSETNSRSDADKEVEMEMRRKSTIHLPESVYDIDEETRMGLDQTPSMVSMMNSSLSTPLPPKKLFQLDDTKDSVDSETKLSATTDTEDIRLRNTISVDQENTKDSVASDSVTEGPTPSKRMKGYREGLGDVLGESKYVFTAENLFEYQWPQDGGEWHLLQEHVSEFLKVKSFKRKYPDLYRRTCDKEEKDFLRDKGVVSETQSDLGLTALRSEEVYDLMMKDYNDKYQEYIGVLQEKQKRVMREKHKEYVVAKLDKSKMDAYSKRAARCAAEFNASLMREKREERQAYFDLQTYTIHHAKNRFRSLPPEMTTVGSYPVALIAGQYQDKFRRFSPDELCNFPLKTALNDPPQRVKYLLRPPASLMKPVVTVPPAAPGSDGESVNNSNEEDVQEEERDKENVINNNKVDDEAEISSLVVETDQADSPFKYDKKLPKIASVKKLSKINSKAAGSPDRGRKPGPKKKEETNEEEAVPDGEKNAKQIHGLEKCRICKQRSSKEDRKKDKLIRCAQCNKIGHMSCLDLTEDLVAVIRTYPWQCMECKTCVQCMDPYDEDKMMFCDRCDRGYHTFCIGLNALPTGHWECRSCVDRPEKGTSQDDDNKEDINSHNVIKDENQDSQDGVKEVKETKVNFEIIDARPMQESDLTTEYLMKLAGRNTNWRKDTTAPTTPQTPPTPSAPIPTPTPTLTPTPVKKEKGIKRKRIETSLNPTRSRPDRMQGARQSKRIKAREEDEVDKKKEDGEEGKKKKKKKKKIVQEAGVKDGKEDMTEDKDGDDKSEEVAEGVDDSGMLMLEDEEKENEEEGESEEPQKNDEEEEKEKKPEDEDSKEEDLPDKEEEEDRKEEEMSVEKEDEDDKELETNGTAEEKKEEATTTKLGAEQSPSPAVDEVEELELEQKEKESDSSQLTPAAPEDKDTDVVLPEIAKPELENDEDVPADPSLDENEKDLINNEADLNTNNSSLPPPSSDIAESQGAGNSGSPSSPLATEITESKNTEAKATGTTESKNTEAKATETKFKNTEAKAIESESKNTEATESESKSTEAEATETESKNTEAEATETEYKNTEAKASETESKNTEAKDNEKDLSIKPPSPSTSSSSSSSPSLSSSSSSNSQQSPTDTVEPPKTDTDISISLPVPTAAETEPSSLSTPPLSIPVSCIPLPPSTTSVTSISDIPLPPNPPPPSAPSSSTPSSSPTPAAQESVSDMPDPSTIPLPMDVDEVSK